MDGQFLTSSALYPFLLAGFWIIFCIIAGLIAKWQYGEGRKAAEKKLEEIIGDGSRE